MTRAKRLHTLTVHIETSALLSSKLTNKKLVSFASYFAISGTFNSLFKVLFTFPSRYLFAIGLWPIFSFRWKLPPILRTTSKVRDSIKACRPSKTSNDRRDSHPLWSLFPERVTPLFRLAKLLKTTIRSPWRPWFTNWAVLGSFAITKRIIFIFFSSAYLYA